MALVLREQQDEQEDELYLSDAKTGGREERGPDKSGPPDEIGATGPLGGSDAARDSSRVVPLALCPLSSPRSEAQLPWLL